METKVFGHEDNKVERSCKGTQKDCILLRYHDVIVLVVLSTCDDDDDDDVHV